MAARGSGLTLGLAATAAVGLALLAQAPAVRTPYFADDFLFLDQVRGRPLVQVLAEPDPIGNYYRPLGRQLYFYGLTRVAGENPVWHHAANLALWALVVALVVALGAAWSGPAAGLFAGAVVAVHHSADVLTRWVSGAQDLLSTAGALACLLLVRSGRPWLAAAALVAGLLAKETILLAPLVATGMEAAWGGLRHALRRTWPLYAAGAAWAVLWLATLGARPGLAGETSAAPAGILAALVQLARVALGAEWEPGDPSTLWRLADWRLALAAGTVVLGALLLLERAGGATAHPAGPAPRRLPAVAAAWALLGALPVAAVAPAWSAYQYLFAVCGAALLAGLGAARLTPPLAAAALLLLAVSTTSAGRLREFATQPSPWTSLSHVNRRYVERSTETVARYLRQLRQARPALPESSVVFYANLPPSVGFQTGDGPVVRWAYGDPTLRSHFFSGFSWELVGRRPYFLFAAIEDSLEDHTGKPLVLHSIAFSFLLEENFPRAEAILAGILERDTADPIAGTWRTWARRGAARDSTAAAGRAAAHARQAEALLGADPHSIGGAIEALACRLLSPSSPRAWRRWSGVQLVHGKVPEAYRSLEEYFRLGGGAALADQAAVEARDRLRSLLPGGAMAQESTRPR